MSYDASHLLTVGHAKQVYDNIKSAFIFDNLVCMKKDADKTKTLYGITFEYSGEVVRVHGTKDGSNISRANLFVTADFNHITFPGQEYLIWVDTQNPTGKVTLAVYVTSASMGLDNAKLATVSENVHQRVSVPDDASYLLMRLECNIADGTVFDNTYTVKVIPVSTLSEFEYNNQNSLPSCNLNSIIDNESWLLSDNKTYTNIPPLQAAGYLTVRRYDNWVLQTFITYDGKTMFARRSNIVNGSWSEWVQVGGGAFFQTNSTHDTNPFHFADMPDNSHTYCVASRFANKPSDVLSTDHIYMSKSNITSVSTRSLFQLYDIEAGIWWTCVTYNGSLDANGWKKSISINEYTNEYTFNTTNISNTINATPEITTDNHNYLASTGDTTDRTNDINTLLSTGCCHLGPGDFYITAGIDMPSRSELIGSGMCTNLILADSVTTGYAVKLANIATVKDLRIKRPQDITLPDSIGDVHGIVSLGTQTPLDPSKPTTYAPTIDNVNIRGFAGGGITCRGTGYDVAASLNATNVVITNCYAGINIPYFSEFNRFTNVNAYGCKIGCINNGGNNAFVNCGFNGNECGILMDNSLGQSPNNSHGLYVGCTVHHSGHNTGKALDLKGIDLCEIFNGCIISYGSINIDNCIGIRFDGIQTGVAIPLNITNSSTIIFSDMQIKSAEEMPLTQSNNVALKFINCYDRAGNVFDPMAN